MKSVLPDSLRPLFLKECRETFGWTKEVNRDLKLDVFAGRRPPEDNYWNWLKAQYAKPMVLARGVVLKQKRLSIQALLKYAGVHWSHTKIAFDPREKSRGFLVYVYALVKPNEVDWRATVSNRVHFPGEQETTLKKGVMPKVLGVTDADNKILYDASKGKLP